MHEAWWQSLTFWMYAIPTAIYAAFVGFYAIRTPAWKRTAVGRGLMTQAASLAAVFAYICLMLAVDLPEDIKGTLRALLIGGVTIAGALMLKNLLIAQSQRDQPDVSMRPDPTKETP